MSAHRARLDQGGGGCHWEEAAVVWAGVDGRGGREREEFQKGEWVRAQPPREAGQQSQSLRWGPEKEEERG